MALGPLVVISLRPWIPSIFGKAINVVPGDPTQQVEIQRADDAAGTNAVTIATGLLFPKSGAPYVDPRSNDGNDWFYRARHNSPGFDVGAWTSPWVGGFVTQIPADVLAASINFGGGSVYPIIRAQPMDGGAGGMLYALAASETDGSTKISSAHNLQGSILPVPWAASLFAFTWGGIATSQMWVAFSWPAQTITRPDGSIVSVPVPPAALSAPALSQVAGGTRGALTLFARIALVRDGQYAGVSAESSLAVSANNLLKITSPASVPGYDGWVPLIDSTTNTEWLQDTVAGSIKPFGTDYTEPTTHFAANVTRYNSAMLGAVFYADLLASTTYYFYAFYDMAKGFIRFLPFVAQGSGAGDTAPSMTDAAKAWADGRVALTPSSFTVTVGAGGGSNSGSTGGSKLT